MLKVKDVDYLNNYRLALLFSDGVRKEVDLEPYLNGSVWTTPRHKPVCSIRFNADDNRMGKWG